jgi:hypothetical protein
MDTQTQAPTPTTGQQYTPRTPLGKKLLEIRQRIVASGRPLLDWDDIDREIAEQRGKQGKEEEH